MTSVEIFNRPAQSSEEVMGPELARVQHFQETLGQLAQPQVLETSLHMDSPEPIADASRIFATMERRAGNNFYLSPDHAELAEAGGVSFVQRQSRQGKKSAHGVFFGDLLFENGAVVPVAVKPHEDDSLESCATDYFANEAAKELELETLDSVGMIVAADEKAYSVTVLDPMLSTLDSIDWKAVAEQGNEELLSTWSQVARYIALLHDSGSASHRDLAPRNIALKADGSGVFLIDWERARLSRNAPRDAEVRYDHSRADLGELMDSMVRPRTSFKAGIGLLSEHPEPWKGFCALVFDEYVGMRLDSVSEKDRRDVEDELIELEHSLKRHMDLIIHQEQLSGALTITAYPS